MKIDLKKFMVMRDVNIGSEFTLADLSTELCLVLQDHDPNMESKLVALPYSVRGYVTEAVTNLLKQKEKR